MPSECSSSNPLQRALADAIIRMLPLDEIRILLACGAKVNEPVTQGLRPLHYAVWQRHEAAVQLLLVRGADVNAQDECGYSAMHLSAEHGYLEIVKILLQYGAKVDYREETDELFPRTTLCDEPLRLAIRNKHMDIARVLLEHGANPNKRYFFGSEINLVNDPESLELLLTFGAHTEARDRAGMTPLMRCARQIQGMECVLLLLSHGADFNAMTDGRNDYRTVLHYAVLSGNTSVVNLLLKQGAKIDAYPPPPELDRPSPLDLAILRGDPALVRLLLEAGACVKRSSPIIGSPLHVACADNIPHRTEIMKMLLSYGADPNMRVFGEDGESALRPPLAELLASNENPQIEEIMLLLRYGARVVMRTPFRDPDGILNCLYNVRSCIPLFNILCEVSESFDVAMIRRTNQLDLHQKAELLTRGTSAMTLKSQARRFFRRRLGRRLSEIDFSSEIPETLHEYLLCQRV